MFLLSQQIPFSKFKSLNGEWEDIGTFHLEQNKIVWHDRPEAIPHGNIYDGNLIKINIPSY